MSVTVKLKYLRIAPRKVRAVTDLIKGKRVEEAQTILEFLVKKPAVPLLKLLKSAIATAKNDFHLLDESNLYISKILVNEGPKLKRWRPASRGRVLPVMKRTSHIVLTLDQIKKTKREEIKNKKREVLETANKTNKKIKVKRDKLKVKLEKEIRMPERKIGLKKIFRRKSI